MRKVKIVICVGTTCYLMGASHLQTLGEILPEAFRPYVEIEGTRCLGLCRERNSGQAPFVKIDGEVMPHANIPAIIKKIENILKHNEQAKK
jgi:NADH:ubiquinone oxidoreductase subunit E